MDGDKSIEELGKEMEKDLEDIFKSSPVKAARESDVHATEEGKAVPETDALLRKMIVRDEPVKVDVNKTGKLVSATWR